MTSFPQDEILTVAAPRKCVVRDQALVGEYLHMAKVRGGGFNTKL